MTSNLALKIAYTSRRPFTDGKVTVPFPENDPANIAYMLGGDYFSFFTLKKLSAKQLKQKLSGYDLVFVPLDHRAFNKVIDIAAACDGRFATYSEGNIADYQMHSPSKQAQFLQIIQQAQINFLYWEKYVPFYRSLTNQPVAYLPYPYFQQEAETFTVPQPKRQRHVTLPSGLAGHTRNGLGSLSVARQLLNLGLVEQINCWLSAMTFTEDAQAIQYFMYGTPLPKTQVHLPWRKWLQKSGIDYRFLLKAKTLRQSNLETAVTAPIQKDKLALFRRQSWQSYLPELAKTMLLIDMNTRETVGRNALDCAAVKVPCISTNRSDIQARLFPDITIDDSWDVDTAVHLCQQLLNDQDFYQSVIQHAYEELTQFNPDAFRQRWQTILNQYPQLLPQS